MILLLFLILSFYKWFYWKSKYQKIRTLISIYENVIEDLRRKGCAQLSCYCKENAFTDLEKYMYKWSKAVVKDTVEDNRIKLKIKSVDNVVVS